MFADPCGGPKNTSWTSRLDLEAIHTRCFVQSVTILRRLQIAILVHNYGEASLR